MSPPSAYDTYIDSGFPRVSGDEPCPTEGTSPFSLFSPRERG